MSETFTKLLSSLPNSSVWAEPDTTRIVWITLLAMSDQDGNIYSSVLGLAHIARVAMPETEAALDTFLSPDPHSRNPGQEGRRLEVRDGGWRLLNHAAIRGTRDPEKRREQNRQAQARFRDIRGKSKPRVSRSKPSKPRSSEVIPSEAETEAETEADTDKKRTTLSGSTRRARCEVCVDALAYLNHVTGRAFRLGKATREDIHACHVRASSDPEMGLNACRSVVNFLVSQWRGTDMAKYLRPSTIFRPAKFARRWADILGGATAGEDRRPPA